MPRQSNSGREASAAFRWAFSTHLYQSGKASGTSRSVPCANARQARANTTIVSAIASARSSALGRRSITWPPESPGALLIARHRLRELW